MRLRLRPQHLHFLEAALIGVFFIQALRFLIGIMYSRVAGASIVLASDPATIDTSLPGVIDPALVAQEITFLIYMLALPLVALILSRFRILFLPTVVAIAVARTFINTGTVLTPVAASGVVIGASLLYIALMIRHRATMFPFFFVIGIGVDELFRAVGNTMDPSVSPDYLNVQVVLAVIVVIVCVIGLIGQMRQRSGNGAGVSPDSALLPFWGGIGIGALLFLELGLLSVPNAIAGRAGVDYTIFVPLVAAATMLPLMPWVRSQARALVSLFDGSVRGWAWFLLMALLVVFGTRFPGILGGAALVLTQFAASLMWWWLIRPRTERDRSFTGLWLIVTVLVFILLAAGDYFTYEYAFVRNFTGDLAFLNATVPPLLRGFRGLGLGVLLLGVFLAAIPMIQTQRRIPWGERRRSALWSLAALILAVAFSVAGAMAARPPLVTAVRGVDRFRVGTYDIHAGFNEFYNFDLEAIAQTIQQSGANVVLIQEAEAGRLTSFGIDEPLWLARRLGMDKRFFGTNENLQGLAVLSNIPIVYSQGTLLTSVGNQTGAMHVQVSTDGVSAVSFYNTWLGLLLAAPGERAISDQEQDQQVQLNELFGVIARDFTDLNQVRLVVGGNFNTSATSPLVEQMRATGFTDPFAGNPDELSATLWRSNQHARTDFLWLRNVLPLGALVMDSHASDHRMAVTEILINRVAQ